MCMNQTAKAYLKYCLRVRDWDCSIVLKGRGEILKASVAQLLTGGFVGSIVQGSSEAGIGAH